MAHFMSQRMRNQNHYQGPSWNELGRQMTGLDPVTPIGPSNDDPPGRWVARANGERYFLPEAPPEPEVPAAPAGVWMDRTDGQRVFVPAPVPAVGSGGPTPAVRPSSPRSSSPSSAAARGGGVGTMMAPPGWVPFFQRLAVAVIVTHVLTEMAEYYRCDSCQEWSGGSVVLWILMVLTMDVGALGLLLGLRKAWQARGRPCWEEVRRRRVGVAETLNSALFTGGEEEQHDSSDEPSLVIDDRAAARTTAGQAAICEGVIVEAAALSSAAAGTTTGDALVHSVTVTGALPAMASESTPDGFVEEL